MKSLTYYLHRIKPECGRIITASVLVLPEVWMNLQLPYLMSIAVSTALKANDFSAAETLIVRMLMLSFGSAVLGYCGAVLVAKATQRFGNSLRDDLFCAVMDLPFAAQSKLETGVLITRMVSDTQIVSRFLSFLVQSVWRPLVVLMFCFIQIHRLGSNAYIWASVIFVLLCAMYVVMSRLSPWFKEIQVHFEKVNSLLKRTLGALRAVKTWNREPWEKARFAENNDRLLELNLRIQSFMAIINPLLMLLVNVAVMFVLIMHGQNIANGSSNIESMMALIIYVQQMMMCVITMGQIFEMTTRTSVSIQRLNEMIAIGDDDGISSGNKSFPENEVGLKLMNLRFSYSVDSPQIIRGITTEFPPGSNTCIIGSTSAGKTTLCLLMARFVEPTEGTVLLNDRDIADIELHELRKKMVLVPQATELAPASFADNIAYGLNNVTRDDVIWAAKVACADEFISKMQYGYDGIVTQEGSSLSGGQKQCIAIARALLRKPSILILDDCCTAMDVDTERRVRESFKTNCPQMTVISVSQRLSCANLFDRMIVLSDGRISAEGSHTELLDKSGLYKNLYLSQNEEARQ